MARNKYQRKTAVILCVLAVAFTLVGCKKETPLQESENEAATSLNAQKPPATGENEIAAGTSESMVVEPNEALVIELGVGVGPVRFGMSKQDVIRHLGQPDKVEEPMPDVIRLDYISSRGLNFGLHPTAGVNYIKCYSNEGPGLSDITTFAGRTKKGVAMGASRNQIVTAYGEPDRTRSIKSLIVLYYDSLRSEMIITNDRLIGIKMVSQL